MMNDNDDEYTCDHR